MRLFESKNGGKSGVSEMRRDIVSGEWVLIATGRSKRPKQFVREAHDLSSQKKDCPFDSSRINNEDPLLWYPHPDSAQKDNQNEWFVQVVTNKYPAVISHKDGTCAQVMEDGPYERAEGVGYHEVIITRSHERSLGEMNIDEAELVIRSYRERYAALGKDACVAYVLVFHNHGKEAGASLIHPHSQLIALPIVPPDVARSFRGSAEFYEQHTACIHCRMIFWELEKKQRIVFENSDFVVVAPYASRVSFELRIYPKEHSPHFELISEEHITSFAEVVTVALGKLYRNLKNPAYNFFIHTTPANQHNGKHYHWHMEILPKISVPAGLELGTGVDVVVVAPEDVPEVLA